MFCPLVHGSIVIQIPASLLTWYSVAAGTISALFGRRFARRIKTGLRCMEEVNLWEIDAEDKMTRDRESLNEFSIWQ